MRVSIVMPDLDIVKDPENDADVNGANIALWIQMRTYANHPDFEELELFLAPQYFTDPEGLRRFADLLVRPENRGKGRLSIHSIYAIGDVWGDGRPRILHSDDLWALARDRSLRARYARGPMAHISDTHCLGHYSLHRSILECCDGQQYPGDAVIACSSATAAALRSLYGGALPYAIESMSRRIDSTGLGVADAAQKCAIRDELGWPQDQKIATFVGRVTPAMKADLALLIDTLAHTRDLPVSIAVAGVTNMPGYHEALMEHAKALGVQDRLLLHGRFPPSRRAAWYQASDLFLFPGDSVNEAFGQTAVESIACGVPVLASDWDGLKDTVRPEYGTLAACRVPPAPERLIGVSEGVETPSQFFVIAQSVAIDRREWMHAFRHWITDDDARAAAGKAAKEAYDRDFDPRVLEQRYVSRLRQALAESGPPQAFAGAPRPPQAVDYPAITDAYASEPWSDRWVFSAAARSSPPIVYDSMGAFLDMDLLGEILAMCARGPTDARTLGERLAQGPRTARDVWWHAMFLSKQGFLLLDAHG